MVSPAVAVAATTSAADSILVAAKENGPPAAGMAAKSSAADSNFPCSKEEWPACSSSTKTAKIEVEIGQVLQ